MPTKKKKTKQSAKEETREVSDDDCEVPKPKLKNQKVGRSEGAGLLKKRSKDSDEEGYDSDSSELDVRISRKKREDRAKAKKKKKKNPTKGSEDELSSDLQATDKEDNNNDYKSKQQISDVIESTRKGKSSSGDKMGSKDKKSKGEDKKSKKDSEKEEEEQVAGDEDEGKKKKKDKKKKGSVKGDSDEDTKKTKGKKKKVENYVEIYENELRNYVPENVENYEDEYHKKKGNHWPLFSNQAGAEKCETFVLRTTELCRSETAANEEKFKP